MRDKSPTAFTTLIEKQATNSYKYNKILEQLLTPRCGRFTSLNQKLAQQNISNYSFISPYLLQSKSSYKQTAQNQTPKLKQKTLTLNNNNNRHILDIQMNEDFYLKNKIIKPIYQTDQRKFYQYKTFYKQVDKEDKQKNQSQRYSQSPIQQRVDSEIQKLVKVISNQFTQTRPQSSQNRVRQFSNDLKRRSTLGGKAQPVIQITNRILNKIDSNMVKSFDYVQPDWVDFVFQGFNSDTIEHVILEKQLSQGRKGVNNQIKLNK